jgi:glycosyltransferase involved in cell wall biosynthesis
MVVPNPYVPSDDLLNISPVPGRKVIGFFGRLEYRKGICDLVEAVPRILKEESEAAFRFVGKPLHHPVTQEPFDAYIMRKLARYKRNIDLTGPIGLPAMPAEYSKVDVCVFPSVWENFPYVCLEAMLAAKAVVGSNSGGMAEMLAGDCGLLIPPNDPDAIAESVVRILKSDELRMQMGGRARRRVVDQYSVDSIGPQMERSYEKAISLSRAKLRREPAF